MTYDGASASVHVSVQLMTSTALEVDSYPATNIGPFVSVGIGDGVGVVQVLVHDLAQMDRLLDLVAAARGSLADMLAADDEPVPFLPVAVGGER